MKRLLLALSLTLPLIAMGYSDYDSSYNHDSYHAKANNTGKYINARVFVPGLFVGWLGIAADIKISPEMTVGPVFKYFAYTGHHGYSFGVNANYALNGDVFSTGWLINPYLQFYKTNYHLDNTKSTWITGANIMYQWTWPSGMNTQVGIGFVYSTLKLPLDFASNAHLHPNANFTIGLIM